MGSSPPLQVSREAYLVFLTLPLAALEEYGVPLRTVNLLEQRYGLYIGGMREATPEDLKRIPQIANTVVEKIQDGLRQLLEEVERTLNGPKAIRVVTEQSIRVETRAG